VFAIPPALDPDILRAFVMIADGASVTRAAERVGRTQSAVSMQMRKLEDILGTPLLARGPRGLAATSQGIWLAERARTLLSLHDEIHANFRAAPLIGQVRLGTPDDYALQWLPRILAGFAETHPRIEVDVVCSNSEDLAQRIATGQLDLTLLTEGHRNEGEFAEIWRGPLRWVGPANHALHRREPLPLALAHPGCTWRAAALGALGRAGRKARVTYNSATQAGCFAVALAGLALTVSTPTRLPAGLIWLGAGENLPELPQIGIELHSAEGAESPAISALAAAIRQGFARQD
jgi:DNA-binding transcriptional LysR family regulator